MHKIIVIGSPGAGKSTFSRKLQVMTGLPLYHLDTVWDKPDKTTIKKEEFDAWLANVTKEERWILDGHYSRTLETRFQACDTVFLLDYSVEACLEGISARLGQKRTDMPWIETAIDEEFRQWVMDFPTKALPKAYDLIKKHGKDKKVFIFKSREETDNFIDTWKGN